MRASAAVVKCRVQYHRTVPTSMWVATVSNRTNNVGTRWLVDVVLLPSRCRMACLRRSTDTVAAVPVRVRCGNLDLAW